MLMKIVVKKTFNIKKQQYELAARWRYIEKEIIELIDKLKQNKEEI